MTSDEFLGYLTRIEKLEEKFQFDCTANLVMEAQMNVIFVQLSEALKAQGRELDRTYLEGYFVDLERRQQQLRIQKINLRKIESKQSRTPRHGQQKTKMG